ncbi:unnamed protein product [Rotaria sordida]|uniref:MATH domain-containing protein n=1 Tax=Rotaria sordida TaxID=392033 RepID=A0A815KKE0_9BILA|nr:unnamed protein product [Rotaria sordida]CAF1155506.1 unnamed protein product [Rotaria sordida]CAF1397362.1 unnamed protein product [Rotaria sordida]
MIDDRGCQLDMEKLNIICSLCDWNGIFKVYQKHLDEAHLNPFCKHCGTVCNTVNTLTQHIPICEKVCVNCLLESYGCNEQFLRMNTQDHLRSEKHQRILLQYILEKTTPSVISSRTMTTNNGEYDTTSMGNLQELHETINIMLDGIKALTDDLQQLGSESLHHHTSLRSMSEDISKLKIAVEETHSLIDAHQTNQQIFQRSLASFQQELEEQKNISTDGTFLWKITNVQQKIVDAQNEQQVSVYSPAFYSSPNGYKMCLRLYLAGDGNARHTHMSLFFVLMRGEYDSILEFPFRFKVTFALLDQISQQRHIFDSFRPDIKSNSFQRPRSDMNTASGIPKFLPLTIIQQDNNPYVRDDTMFIKAIVDFSDIPKQLVPYTLSVNPGLPILTQHELIKREIEKRAQEKSQITSNTSMSINQDMNMNHAGNNG